jgi:hypothetical protein
LISKISKNVLLFFEINWTYVYIRE